MSAREAILGRVRTALNRKEDERLHPIPPVRLSETHVTLEDRVASFCSALEKLAGKTFVAANPAGAVEYVRAVTGDQRVIASNSLFLQQCGLAWPAIDPAVAEVGLTTAEYAFADTGSIVVQASSEPRLFSLLPPVHIALIRAERILTGLDELLTVMPQPADLSSSTVLITGPSRTADIEQILVRGVHGPGELHVVICHWPD